MSRFSVAVFGATGHTGRFVVAELLRRGLSPIAIARNSVRLADAGFSPQVTRRVASLADPDDLDRALDGAHAVINCAGPFLETASIVASAAIRAGVHYLDVTAEQASAKATLDEFGAAACAAGVVVLPAMGFFGGFADLLATAAMGDWNTADAIEIMIGLDGWHPTRGTRRTGERNTAPRVVVTRGELAQLTSPSELNWTFGGPFGTQAMVEVPLSEIILLQRHLEVPEIHSWLSSNALNDIRDPATPEPRAVDDAGHSAQKFVIDVMVRRAKEQRRITARGRDIYAFSAPLVCEALERLLAGTFYKVGAHVPGATLDARGVLSKLVPEHLALEVVTG